MKIVFLDRKSIGRDLDLSEFYEFGEVVMHDHTPDEDVPERVKDADIIIINKTPINKETIGGAEKLKLVCITATGTNNLDKEYLAERGIAWRNVANYSTENVAQHTFAILFYLWEHLRYYDDYVKEGRYAEDTQFTHFGKVFSELSGKTWGIIGLGNIGRRVAGIATAFGCRVQYYSTTGKNHASDYREVSFDELLATSDIISIHAPLNASTEGLINKAALSKMKKEAVLLNLGRGPIVVEKDLREALDEGLIRAAGLDVLSEEPMSRESPFLGFKDSDRLFITPHIAWASIEARTRLMHMVANNIREFLG
ncbi:MAG: D-2-hydroxyacid dehydrogenase [Firmicutes bacterium]|nr:D-2-hydroxyacid dehydrogenase [Bacillota bacterium]